MSDEVNFTASGEMDNGWTVSTKFQIDGAAYDDRNLVIDTGDMGKITFSGHGTSGPIGSWDDVTPNANEEAHGTAVAGTQDGATNAPNTNNSFHYDYTVMDGLALKASYFPSGGSNQVESSMEYGLLYTGVDGLSLYGAMGENNDRSGAVGKMDNSVFAVKYAMENGLSIGYQANESDSGVANEDEDFTAIGVSYAVTEDMSISYNISEIDYESSTKDNQEATGFSFSMTNGGLTVSGSYSEIDNVAGTSTADNTGYDLNFAFAF